MTTHICNRTSNWADGTVTECGCSVRTRTILNRTGYQNKKKVWSPGPGARQREHFSGRLDAKVKPKPIRVRMKTE